MSDNGHPPVEHNPHALAQPQVPTVEVSDEPEPAPALRRSSVVVQELRPQADDSAVVLGEQ